MIPRRSPAETGPSSLREVDVRDVIEALDKKRSRFLLLSVLMLLILGWVLLEASPGIAAGATLLSVLPVKRAIREYLALAAEKQDLLSEGTVAPGGS